MTLKTQKAKQHAKLISTFLTISMLTACATTNTRDERLLENLEKQNAVIDATVTDRSSDEIKAELENSEALKEAEVRLQKALVAVKDANTTVIQKMKPTDKKECAHGQDEGDGDEQ